MHTNSKKNFNQETQDQINYRIEAIIQAGLNSKPPKNYTLKQAHQIEEKNEQLYWEGQRQSERANNFKAREINVAFEQREKQKQQNQ